MDKEYLQNTITIAHINRELKVLQAERDKIIAKIKGERAAWIASLVPASNPHAKVKWRYKDLNKIVCLSLVAEQLDDAREASKNWGIVYRNMRLYDLHKCLNMLSSKGFNAAEISSILNMPLSTVYYHLNKIKESSPVKHNPDYLYVAGDVSKCEVIINKQSKKQIKVK